MISYDFRSKINTNSIDSIYSKVQKVVDLLSDYDSGGKIIKLSEESFRVTSKINNFKAFTISHFINGQTKIRRKENVKGRTFNTGKT